MFLFRVDVWGNTSLVKDHATVSPSLWDGSRIRQTLQGHASVNHVIQQPKDSTACMAPKSLEFIASLTLLGVQHMYSMQLCGVFPGI